MVGKINYFIFEALIFWKKVKVWLAFENYCPVEFGKFLRNECSVEIKGSNYNETFICSKKINALK
jgi:hypothetical protein